MLVNIRPFTTPVLAVWTFEWFVWIVDSQMAFEVSLASELLRADCTLEQDLGWHMNHLEMHLQNVLVFVFLSTDGTFAAGCIMSLHVTLNDVTMLGCKSTDVTDTLRMTVPEV